MVIVGRHINDITINPLEYLIDASGNEIQFESKKKAIDFLKENGYSDDDIYWLVFKEIDENGEEEVI